MSNLEHLIENGLCRLDEGTSYREWREIMQQDCNWKGNENITLDNLWEICQYIIFTWDLENRLRNGNEVASKMIVITTMDSLPELCYECPCHDGENGQCNADKEKRYSAEYRPYWCPLKNINSKQEGNMRTLRIIGAGLRIEMKDGETKEQAEDRLLDMLEEVGVTCWSWNKSETEED